MTVRVDLLDVGPQHHGDAILCRSDGATILVDGAHSDSQAKGTYDRLLSQLRQSLDRATGPIEVDLLVVSHAHEDHIGCLPELVADGLLNARWVLLTSPDDAGLDTASLSRLESAGVDAAAWLASAEESLIDLNDEELAATLARIRELPSRYPAMIDRLGEQAEIVFAGTDYSELERHFSGMDLSLIGPTRQMIDATRGRLERVMADAAELSGQERWIDLDAISTYRAIMSTDTETRALAEQARTNRNMQSVVMTIGRGDERVLLTGDSQLADPEQGGVVAVENRTALEQIKQAGPYGLVKLPHHGSSDGLDNEIIEVLGASRLFGIITGSSSPKHPNPLVLAKLQALGAHWDRTDVNGHVSITLGSARPPERVRERGIPDDPVLPADRP